MILFAYLKVFEKEIENDNTGLLEVCDQALYFFEQKDFETPAATKSLFFLKKIMVYTNRNENKKALENIDKVMNIEYPQNHNYSIALQYKVLIALRENNSQLTTNIIVSIQNKKGYLGEAWKILEAYIHLFIAYGEIEMLPDLPKFRLSKFLNETPILKRDKMGFNSSLLILQFMFLLQEGDKGRDKLVDRIESLNGYLRTHLRGRNDLQRTRIFIQLLLKLPKNSYRHGVVAHQTKSLLKSLKNAASDVGGQIEELEIVPYERLWDMVMKSL